MTRNDRFDEVASAVTTATLTLLCVLIHIPLVYIIIRKRSCRSSFFSICAGRSCAHIIGSVSVGVPCAIALFISRPFLPTFINGYYYMLTFLFLTELVISTNRFMAVIWFAKSNAIFTGRRTLGLLVISACITLFRAVLSISVGCVAHFDHIIISMIFDVENCDSDIILLALFEFLMCFAFGMNLVTLYKLVRVAQRGVGSDRLAKERLRQNGRHFMFTFAQSVIWMVIGLSIIIRSQMFKESRYGHFVMEDLVEFIGSIAEGILFWCLHWKKIFSSVRSGQGSRIISITPNRNQ